MSNYGIRGVAYDLIHSYLHNRQQFVSNNQSKSDLKLTHCWVPQGSSLGPLFFLVYINDLNFSLKSQPRLFADDTCLIVKGFNPEQLQIKIYLELQNLHQLQNLHLFRDWKHANTRLHSSVYELLRDSVPARRTHRTCQNNGGFSKTNPSSVSNHSRLWVPATYLDSAQKGGGLGQKRKVYVLHRTTFARGANDYGKQTLLLLWLKSDTKDYVILVFWSKLTLIEDWMKF